MAGDEERLIVLVEARLTDLEKQMKRGSDVTTREFGKMRRTGKGAMDAMEQDVHRSTSRINQALAASSTKIGAYGKAFAGGLIGGIAAGGVMGIVTQMHDIARGYAEIGDQAKMAGLSTKSFQELAYVAKANRIEVDALTDGMKELALRADEYIATGKGSAAESFQRLGISAEELKVKLQDPSALFSEIIGKLGTLSKAAQIRISDELFGGSAGEKFVQLIAQGEEGIRATVQEAHNLSAVIGDDVIRQATELDRNFLAISTTVRTALQGAIVDAAFELTKFIDQFRVFENRATSTLSNRFSELQTRYGQLVKQQGSMEDKALGWIGKDAATEMQAVKAEMDQIASQLRQRATPQLREQLMARRTANEPYTPPPSTSKGRSAGRDKAAAQAEREAAKIRDLIAELEEELRLVGASDTQKEISATLRRANVEATSKEGQQISQLVTQIEAETAALEKQKEAQEARTEALSNMFEMGEDALTSMLDGSVKAEDAMKKLAVQIALAALQASLLGTGPLAGLFGGGGGLFGGSTFTPTPNGFANMLGLPGHAKGTANTGGARGDVRGLVHGQEAVIPLPNGGKVPVQIASGAAGGNVTVDARTTIHAPNADKEGLARIEAMIRQRDNELPARIKKVVANRSNERW